MIRIILADDHLLFTDGLASLLKRNANLHIAGIASNGEELMLLLNKHKIDLLLLDINMPFTDVFSLVKIIKTDFPSLKIIMLTMQNGTKYYIKFSKLPINGYVCKDDGIVEVLNAIHSVYNGTMYISKKITELNSFQSKREAIPLNTTANPEKILTKREIEILLLIVQEYSNKEIATKLFLSVGTVDTHRKNILFKLGVKNTVGLIKYCLKYNLLPSA